MPHEQRRSASTDRQHHLRRIDLLGLILGRPKFTLVVMLVTIHAAAPPLIAEDTFRWTGLATGPQPGEIFREFSLHNGGNIDWRVTDDAAVEKFEAAKDHLPNSTLKLSIADMEHAVRAEMILDRWGGHRGTIAKRVSFNGNTPLLIPEIGTHGYGEIDEGLRGEMLMYQDNPAINVPIDHLREGENLVLADCDEAGGFGWGQWGLYSLNLRVYYDPHLKRDDDIDLRAAIVSPGADATIRDNCPIDIDAEANMGVARIDVLARYEGLDEDGDGRFGGYHQSRFQMTSGDANRRRDHVATLWKKPYAAVWDTTWVPDQSPGTISLQAWVQDSRGYWTVSHPVAGLTLSRPDHSVRHYRSTGVPEDFAVRVGEVKTCQMHIPEHHPLAAATDARLHLRTWHGWDGHHEPLRLNDYRFAVDGKNHFFDDDRLPIPVSRLNTGDNEFAIESHTDHHMLEVLWPGPVLMVRYDVAISDDAETTPSETSSADSVRIERGVYGGRPHHIVSTASATYWIDDPSGGMSRLIDPHGRDWIAFRPDADEDYPRSAATSFRGLPNAVFGGSHSGFGHPGFDVASTEQTAPNRLAAETLDGRWSIEWTFHDDHADLVIEPPSESEKYWFLYEGPIAGRFTPLTQFIVTDRWDRDDTPRDYQKGDRHYDHWRWAAVGDRQRSGTLFLVDRDGDEALDTFSHLGSDEAALESEDGMVVFGFGRGRGKDTGGIEPLLSGVRRFRIALHHSPSDHPVDYAAVAENLLSNHPGETP